MAATPRVKQNNAPSINLQRKEHMTDDSDRSSEGTDVANETVRAQYEWSSTSPSTAVIKTVAIALDREPTTIDPLYEFVDPDALDTVIQSYGAATDTDPVTVSFVFAEQQITIYSSGEVVVHPVELDG